LSRAGNDQAARVSIMTFPPLLIIADQARNEQIGCVGFGWE
jgi:hypothetical protein